MALNSRRISKDNHPGVEIVWTVASLPTILRKSKVKQKMSSPQFLCQLESQGITVSGQLLFFPKGLTAGDTLRPSLGVAISLLKDNAPIHWENMQILCFCTTGSGEAISESNHESFHRYSNDPIALPDFVSYSSLEAAGKSITVFLSILLLPEDSNLAAAQLLHVADFSTLGSNAFSSLLASKGRAEFPICFDHDSECSPAWNSLFDLVLDDTPPQCWADAGGDAWHLLVISVTLLECIFVSCTEEMKEQSPNTPPPGRLIAVAQRKIERLAQLRAKHVRSVEDEKKFWLCYLGMLQKLSQSTSVSALLSNTFTSLPPSERNEDDALVISEISSVLSCLHSACGQLSLPVHELSQHREILGKLNNSLIRDDSASIQECIHLYRPKISEIQTLWQSEKEKCIQKRKNVELLVARLKENKLLDREPDDLVRILETSLEEMLNPFVLAMVSLQGHLKELEK